MDELLVFFIILVGITAFSIVFGGLGKRWLELKRQQLDHAALLAADKAAERAGQVERLEERMRVLERIVTDRGNKLAAEIAGLRDDRVN